MAQITLYLEDHLENELQRIAKSQGLSNSKWVANLIARQLRDTWPADVLEMAGSWNDDFPLAEEIRSSQGLDVAREPF